MDENEGVFTDDGREVRFHNARFSNLGTGRLFRVSFDQDSGVLPPPFQPVSCRFEVAAGERYCRLVYRGYSDLA